MVSAFTSIWSFCGELTDPGVLYVVSNTTSNPRRKVGSVSVPEMDWTSVVPPKPPAALTLRAYRALAEPKANPWTRLAGAAGDTKVSPPSSVMGGATLTEPGGGGGRRERAPRGGV